MRFDAYYFSKNSLSLLTLLAVLVLPAFITLNQVELIPLCIFKFMLGFDCPGCGLTRSFVALLHKDFLQSIHYNGFGVLIYFLLLYRLLQHLIVLFSLPLSLKTIEFKKENFLYYLFPMLVGTQWFFKLFNSFLTSFLTRIMLFHY